MDNYQIKSATSGYGCTQPTITIGTVGGPSPQPSPFNGVDRLGENLDLLEKAIANLASRIDPVLRPSQPCGAEAKPLAVSESRISSLVTKVVLIRCYVESLTDRVEA